MSRESATDKMKKICDVLREETLEPARKEVEMRLQAAHQEAEAIVAQARAQSAQILREAEQQMEQKRVQFEVSLQQAGRQVLASLKQQVEQHLFNPELASMVKGALDKHEVLARLIEAVVTGLGKGKMDGELSAFVSSLVPAQEINGMLAKEILSRLKEKSVLLSPIGGGVQVKCVGEHVMIDVSDATFKEVLVQYIRKDFYDLLFNK